MGDIVGDITVVEVRLMTWVIEQVLKLLSRCAIIRNGYVDIKRFHLVEQHLLWNFHYAETPSIFQKQ
jgi:hypothetical protein